jgi:hypothetical protein
MPIRPEDRERYPPEWPEISRRIREDRAEGRCECTGQCGADHGAPGARCSAMHGEPHPLTGSKVVITVGHLDRTPENCEPENLCGFCQDCHLAYDLEDHVAQALWTKSVRRLADRRNHELFALQLGHTAPRRDPERTLTHVWRIRTNLAERHGDACRILARGKMNSILVEFADGTRHIVSRHAVRRRRVGPAPIPVQLEAPAC